MKHASAKIDMGVNFCINALRATYVTPQYLSRDIYGRRSRGKILAALEAKKFGILLSTKNGQHNMGLATLLKQKIEKAGLCAEVLVANTFDFGSIDNLMEFDALVNTACPRIAIDDTDRTRKPLLSANELMEVIRMKAELNHKDMAISSHA